MCTPIRNHRRTIFTIINYDSALRIQLFKYETCKFVATVPVPLPIEYGNLIFLREREREFHNRKMEIIVLRLRTRLANFVLSVAHTPPVWPQFLSDLFQPCVPVRKEIGLGQMFKMLDIFLFSTYAHAVKPVSPIVLAVCFCDIWSVMFFSSREEISIFPKKCPHHFTASRGFILPKLVVKHTTQQQWKRITTVTRGKGY